jgi:hypothetical protein
MKSRPVSSAVAVLLTTRFDDASLSAIPMKRFALVVLKPIVLSVEPQHARMPQNAFADAVLPDTSAPEAPASRTPSSFPVSMFPTMRAPAMPSPVKTPVVKERTTQFVAVTPSAAI